MAAQARTAAREAAGQGAGRFGTFAGVFTPNVLTILGIILFLRIGQIVGQMGMWWALTIVLLANMISLLTGLSLSAVATSMEVKAGGNYYLISRSLGLEIGGAIGIPLYLSQAISVAFYIIGFTEALLSIPFFQPFDPRLISTAVALLFAVIAYIGADFALKIQFFILAILIGALLSFFAGGWDEFISPTNTPFVGEGSVGYWVAFAIFFPAVTGIEVGTSLSGDLKDPSKSIPLGTISSILITAVIYLIVVVWFATHLTPEQLINNNLAMQEIAVVPALILAGVWASTLSSALGSVLAAPRTLQAVALDNVAPRWMANQMGSRTEPRMAVLITAVIAISIIWLGDLDVVAPVISMFFLNTYGMVNLAAAIEKLVGNPSFRPRFKIPWVVSLLGAIGCYGAMFLINTPATFIAILVSGFIFYLLQRRHLTRTWGDVGSGIWFSLSRFALLKLDAASLHVKNWRPNLLVFTGQPHNREQLVEVAEWLSRGKGIVTFFQLIVGDFEKLAGHGIRETARKRINSYIHGKNMTAFGEAEIVSNFEEGALTIMQAHGVGALEPNTALLGWSRTEGGRAMQMRLMRRLVLLGKSVLFLNYHPERGFGQRQIINVWWQGRGGNADLMLLLAYIITRHREWGECHVRLLRVIDNAEGLEDTKAHMEKQLHDVKVEAEPIVIVRKDPTKPIAQVIAENSSEADLTMLGMQVPNEVDPLVYSNRLDELVNSVGSVLLVRNAQLDAGLLNV